MCSTQTQASGQRVWYLGPALVGLGAGIAVLVTLAPDGAGPGITCDELYHALTAKRQVWALERHGWRFFTRPVVEEVFPFHADGPPAHPPLVHWVLGWVHRLVDPAPQERQVVSIVGARLGTALGYGLLVLLIGLWTARQAGPLAGTAAALACALMPRVFAHGHLAALEIWTALTLLGAALAAGWAETTSSRPTSLPNPQNTPAQTAGATGRSELRWLAAGAAWGLALLTRFHAGLLGPVVVGWLLLRTKGRCLARWPFWRNVGIWTAAAAVVFFVGWPWLWYSTAEHLQIYLASATQRMPIHVYYLGRVWLDWQTPWHYPWVIFAATVPVGLLLLGLVGLWVGCRAWSTQPHWGLLAALAGAGLVLFSWPGVPVYDGERLFLFVYPIWAIFVGLGCQSVHQILLQWASRKVSHQPAGTSFRRLRLPLDQLIAGGVLLLVVGQGVGLVLYHPCQLSYYNLLVGGLAGADRLGLEVNYWADAVREPLLREAAARAPGQQVLFAPHLAPFQAPGIAISSPALAESQTELLGLDPAIHASLFRRDNSSPAEVVAPAAQASNHFPPGPSAQWKLPSRWLIVYHRKADLAAVEPLLAEATVAAEYRLRGVWLARLVQLPGP